MSHIKHSFVTAKADGTDATLVKPSNWNADHDMTTDADGVVLGRTAGAGAGAVQELPFSAVLPYGTVLPFAGATSPAGWLICDGSSLLRSTYPGLFAAIGVAYGAADGAHFSIPDLRGRTIAGLDPTGTRLTAASTVPDGNTLGATGGVQQVQPRVYGIVDVPVSVSVTVGGSLSVGVSGYTTSGSDNNTNATGGGSNVAGAAHGHSISATGTASGNLSGSGSGSGAGNIRNDGNNVTDVTSNLQPTLLMNWIIKT